MNQPPFDLDVLRSFVLGIELGSFAKAAERVGRSTSAVSAQLKKLEAQVEVPILVKSGRGLSLTPTGEVLLSYARRLLDLDLEAQTALRGAELIGCVRIGLQEDFGEHLLTEVLGCFAHAHPNIRIEARVTRNAELLDLVGAGRLDLALAWDSGRALPYSEVLGQLAMRWIGPRNREVSPGGGPLPLAVLEGPCVMRSTAITALDQAHRPWSLTYTSPSLGGVWAAVAAGLGITVRTRIGLPSHLKVLTGFPALPALGLVLHFGTAQPPPVVGRLADLVKRAIAVELAADSTPQG